MRTELSYEGKEKELHLLEGSQDLPTNPSDKSRMQMKIQSMKEEREEKV